MGDNAVGNVATDLGGLEPFDVRMAPDAFWMAVRMASSMLVVLLPTISFSPYT
jgi:hypothetical protein